MSFKAKHFLASVLIFLLSALAALALAESFASAFLKVPQVAAIQKGRYRLSKNPKIIYEPVENFLYRGPAENSYQYQGKSNALGYRGPVYSVKKPEGIFRIAVLGDSITEGLKISDERQLFTSHLETILRYQTEAAQVMNFGVSGYNTQQEVETLKDKVLPYRPDLIVLAYCLNDRYEPEFYIVTGLIAEAARVRSYPFDLNKIPWLTERALFRLGLQIWERFRKNAPASTLAGKTFEHFKTGDTVLRSLEELKTVAQANQIPVLMVVIPIFFTPDLIDYPYHSEHALFQQTAASHGFYYLDLLEAFRKHAAEFPSEILDQGDKIHLNPAGHAFVARQIAAYIMENVKEIQPFVKRREEIPQALLNV